MHQISKHVGKVQYRCTNNTSQHKPRGKMAIIHNALRVCHCTAQVYSRPKTTLAVHCASPG